MKRTILTVILVVLLVVGGVVVVSHKSNKSNSNTNNSSSSYSSNTNNQPTSTGSNSSQAAPGGSVDIKNMMFTPSQITVQTGEKVTWTNNDSTTHTVVDDLNNVGGPNSGPIAPGQTFSFTFTKAASYQYHCSIHPSMRGTIVVK
jgi:plastocyanin